MNELDPIPTPPEPAPMQVPLPEPVAPQPVAPQYAPNPAPVPHTGHGHIVALTVVIAIIGVLVSGFAGGLAGYVISSHVSPKGGATSALNVKIDAKSEPIAAAAAVALPSVVNIDVTSVSSGGGSFPQGHPDVPSGGTGSGVAFKSTTDGGTYILTNNHVVENAKTITVTPADGEKVEATLVGTDPQTDIAVVKVPVKLPTVPIGDSEKLIVGQTVIAIGSPFGLQHSVSSGVVSALHRAIAAPISTDPSSTANPLVDVIQTDAAINPGNSGGALIDRAGQLVGINSAIYTESGSSAGIGFAIPTKTAIRIATELISGGSAKHPFLGVEGRTVTTTAAVEAGLAKAQGALIENVFPDTSAAKAGLRQGDIVTALDGTPIRSMDDLILAVRRAQVGQKVALTVWRNKAEITVEMTIGDKPATLQ